ncbi:cysteine desulfurase family protein [Microlunatus ginsengisoli]|uniref:cysteine desulfurase n=1 Tax=Microlunatus ginsengisoli TaxID=363863 RepID=A0ABP6ZK32_9ACTN
MRRVYLDHAATTPMVPEAIEAMTRQFATVGNASSLHGSGRTARRVVEDARESIAARLGALPVEVVFTSGGTEADNLAVKGAWWSGRAATDQPARAGVVVSAIEHHAVLDTAGWVREQGGEVALAPVDGGARLALAALADLVDERTAVVSVMWANNEVGTLQPVREVAELAAARGALSHSDAVQAVGHVSVDFGASGLDLMSCTSHKLGGPVGIGALVIRRGLELTPMLHGGGQERDLRSGTIDVAAIAGFAAAIEVADGDRAAEDVRLRELRAELTARLRTIAPDVVVNTPDDVATLPGILSVTFPGCEADAMMMLLDAAGIDCATGSACSAGVAEPSHVLLAMGRTERDARSTLRFSLGRSTAPADIDALIAALPEALARARMAGAVAGARVG